MDEQGPIELEIVAPPKRGALGLGFSDGVRNGRPPGSKNKVPQQFREALRPITEKGLQLCEDILLNKLPCSVCRGELKTSYKLPDGEIGTRLCESCYGSGYEKLSPELRARVALELLQYQAPKLKAVEHSGEAQSGPKTEITVVFTDGRRI